MVPDVDRGLSLLVIGFSFEEAEARFKEILGESFVVGRDDVLRRDESGQVIMDDGRPDVMTRRLSITDKRDGRRSMKLSLIDEDDLK